MKVTFNNPERTDITLTTGMWWWKRVAKVRRYTFEERWAKRGRGALDPVQYRYVATGDEVRGEILTAIYVAEYRAAEPEREAKERERYNLNWKRP